jgi:hypothetical protein
MYFFFLSVLFSIVSKANASENMQMWATGKWSYDVEASMNRCMRLSLSDCQWENLDEAQLAQKKEAYREGFSKMNGVILNFSATVMMMGDRSSNIKVVDGENWSHLSIETTETKEGMVLLRETNNILCFSERGNKSDAMCFRSLK